MSISYGSHLGTRSLNVVDSVQSADQSASDDHVTVRDARLSLPLSYDRDVTHR